ncbi:septal ring lytic transglycosylase RlpA family lipoprotein [Campylobacter sp. MIT 99-7217]|uniref:septal ring lytic transglycosylase RlpA family protein n=1 Tax=Campylobacter sp. MIT 99-7217 TaxID=535091 RepID=UPI00115A765A|nr:septal ring lytic transglycosylase RlpA family protein [Campylobacter sp. MIT 99-7217]TQR31902.1 septal ring lytic transglycosylase RlpA family lipoprotein [Campylobacter sp. MIT 99-7217]
MQILSKQKNLLRLLVASFGAILISACTTTKSQPTTYYPGNDFKSTPNNSKNLKGTMKPYTINGKTYYPTVVEVGETADGIASWYGPGFHGKKTSNGETYNQNAFTAAHKTLPMNTILKVTNLNNNRQTTVRINDRGPFVDNRIIDLSKAAATQIDMVTSGTAPVRLEVIGFGTSNTDLSSSNSNQIVHQNVNLGSSGEIVDNGHIYEGGNFMVQIGAFRNAEGARITADKYKNYGAYSSVVRQSPKDGLNRVFLTGFRSEAEARDFARSGAFSGAFVVRE